MIMGDTGTGKSALMRQVLMQIAERDETAIVYDPALEYTPQFYKPARGDLILNPLDARCPYWSPCDEVMHEAEALTLATSLFPDKPRENTFFVEGPRKIFAHLLTLKPTPEELVWWMSHEDELDRKLEGTELAAFLYRGAGPQRGGVLGALNMVADCLKLLPQGERNEAALDGRGMVQAAERLAVSDFHSALPRAAVAADQPVAGHAGAAVDEPGRSRRRAGRGSCWTSWPVCNAAAVAHGDDGEPEIEQPGGDRLSGPQPARGALRA